VSRDMKTEVTRIEEALDKILTAIEEHERSTDAERPKRPFKFAAAADVTAIDDLLDDPVGRSLRRGIKELGQRLFELGGTKLMEQVLDRVVRMGSQWHMREDILDKRWDSIGDESDLWVA
jgi:hypothetical protein